jgi:succinate dehydrogenase hydrophobic anchor subunit
MAAMQSLSPSLNKYLQQAHLAQDPSFVPLFSASKLPFITLSIMVVKQSLLSNPRVSRSSISPRSRASTPRWVKLVVAGLILTTTVSGFLLYLAYKEKTFQGAIYTRVVSNRPIVQIFVQLISQFFSLIHIFVLTKLFNGFTIERLQKRPVSLDCLKWWNAMCQRQWDSTLPSRLLWPLAGFICQYLAKLPTE